jgi:hypothetical protein
VEGYCEHGDEPSGSIKRKFSKAEPVAAYQQGLSSMELLG